MKTTTTEYQRLTGFKHSPPTAEEIAIARTAHEKQMAAIDAEIKANPELQQVADEIQAEAEVALQLHKRP